MDCITVWVEVKALWDNITKNVVKFIYENIITRFDYPTHFVNLCNHGKEGNYFEELHLYTIRDLAQG
jgi:hypothetical protein